MCGRIPFQSYPVRTPNARRQILRLLTGLTVLWTWPQVLHHSTCVLAPVAPVGDEAEIYYRFPDAPQERHSQSHECWGKCMATLQPALIRCSKRGCRTRFPSVFVQMLAAPPGGQAQKCFPFRHITRGNCTVKATASWSKASVM